MSAKKVAGYPVSKEQYKIKITDHILDNLYGHIGITEVERKLEKLPLFKRLHNISQLGLTNWIFPCALHTRYVHSFGVMHVAYTMALHINENCGGFFTDTELQIIRITGMLHDIGHYPLSHNIETAYKNGNREKIFFENTPVRDFLEQLVGCPKFLHPDAPQDMQQTKGSEYLKGFSGSGGYHHEAIGGHILTHNKEIHNIIKENLVLIKDSNGNKFLNPEFVPKRNNKPIRKKYTIDEITKHLMEMIAAIVIGNYEYSTSEYEYEDKYSVMLQLIHSELDADNLDYSLRDATFSGTSYGFTDLSVLLNCLTVEKLTLPDYLTKIDEDGRTVGNRTVYVMGILPKGIGCVEQFFHNKYLAYSHMILSKYVSILEAMILHWATVYLPADAIYGSEGNVKKDKGLMSLVKAEESSEEFLRFTDAYVMREFSNLYDRQESQPIGLFLRPSALAKTILSRLTRYIAFDLEDSGEELCVDWEDEKIVKAIKGTDLYKEFESVYRKFESMPISEYYTDKNAKELFAYRFETYTMTKQIPINIFCKEYILDMDSPETVVNKHFYRLANGVPILPKDRKDYELRIEEGHAILDNIPQLVVDIKSSSMRRVYMQKLVYLRKYKIEDYSKEDYSE